MGTREHPNWECLKQGEVGGTERTAQTKTHLGDSHSSPECARGARPRHVQPAINSKLRGCSLVGLRVRDVTHGSQLLSRAMLVQRKTQRTVQFERIKPTRTAMAAWIANEELKSEDFLFPNRLRNSPHVSTRQYARIVEHWVVSAGLDPTAYDMEGDRCGDPALAPIRRPAEGPKCCSPIDGESR